MKKFRIINSLNKPCFLTKYSQYYVDYKFGIVYFFNILFSSVVKITQNENDLIDNVANCYGYIPQEANSKENEI